MLVRPGGTSANDGLASYIEAWKQELRAPEGGRNSQNTHVREIHLTDHSKNNNIVERLNGTVRGRQKAVRGLKKSEGPLTRGQAAYYNLVKPHLSLGGLTPAEAAGLAIPVGGTAGWGSSVTRWPPHPARRRSGKRSRDATRCGLQRPAVR